jgi:outer membrane PBP1 activator LpoA protein
MKKVIFLFILAITLSGCSSQKPAEEPVSEVPYPPDEEIQYYQAQCDSGSQKYLLDLRATSSAFLNNSKYADIPVKFDKIKIIGETILNGRVDVEFDSLTLQLKLARKYKALGIKSIWQVVSATEKPWTKSDLK